MLIMSKFSAGPYLPDKPVVITVYSENGKLSQLQDVVFSFDNGKLEISAKNTPLSFLRVRWNFAIPSKTLFCGDAWERTYGDSQWRSFDPGRMMPWYFWASLPDGRIGCCGVQVRPSCFAAWSADPAGITLWCDIRSGGKGVILNGRTLVVAQIKSSVYDGCSAFEAAREFCVQLCPDPIFPPTPVYGSNNWYYAYGDITEASVLEDCRYLAELTAGLSCRPFMTIDAGWQKLPHTYGGPWNEGNKNFPDMPQLAGKMKAFGVRPGIWYRPLYTHDTSLKKELFLKNTPYTLDPSHPEVTELVARDVSRFREWGFELIKHDFMTFDTTGRYAFDMHPWPCNNGWEFFDRNRTSAEILLDLLKTIRNAAGPVLIMGCNTIGHLAAGLQELSRAGDDTSGKRWERTCKMGVNTVAFRSCQHRTFFDVDSDCVGITGSIPWKYNRQWAELAAASGCAFFVSPQPGILSAAEKD
jgi:alpha-galactosidase